MTTTAQITDEKLANLMASYDAGLAAGKATTIGAVFTGAYGAYDALSQPWLNRSFFTDGYLDGMGNAECITIDRETGVVLSLG